MATPLFQHLVVLMLENRSFDHMLGFLTEPGVRYRGVKSQQSADERSFYGQCPCSCDSGRANG